MKRMALQFAVSAALAVCLAGCGGGTTGGNGLASAPPPPPPPPPPMAKIPFAVTSDTTFAVVGDDVEFRWISSANAYEIRLPSGSWQRLSMLDSQSTYEKHYPSTGTYYITVSKGLDYQYTNLAWRHDNAFGFVQEDFAYGIPTTSADMPTTGTASYTAKIFGGTGYNLSGDVDLTFDFGAGTLAGSMHPLLSDAWFTYDFGKYDFTQAVYSTGSTTFSGKFVVPGGGSSADSGFNGQFTGPQAAELMASFHAPFRDPYDNQWHQMSGVWIGEKK